MNQLLQRFKIGSRLSVSYTVLVLLMATIGVSSLISFASLNRNLDAIGNQSATRLKHANAILDANNGFFNHLQAMIITSSEERLQDFHQQFLQSRQDFIASFDALTKMESDAETHAALEEIATIREQSKGYNTQVTELALANDKQAAADVMREQAIPTLNILHSKVSALVKREEAKMSASMQQAETMTQRSRTLILAVMALSVLASIGLAVAITRSLTIPLARATRAANDLAAGKFDAAPLQAGNDEVGDVMRAVQQTREAVMVLAGGLEEMIREHGAGNISFYPDPSILQGDYRKLGESIVAMVSEHVQAGMLAGRLAERYALGDLSEDFPRVPGEKAVLMNAMDNVKASIHGISAEILHVSQAAVHGNFSVRGDESQFQFGFRDMVANLNQLMATADDSLDSLSGVLKRIADGDLTVRMEGDYQGVFARMRDDANATVANLTDIVARIQAATGNINTAAGEIASGNADLSRRTEQQAANLEETAASMEELTSTVRQNAEHANQANQLAIGAADVATTGGKVVGEVVTTMGQIEESSRRIADIISVIDGIAFQTNILALNAAVEAARAGEQGRGFAVVASEVRTLAQRSAAAAKEIKELIDNSVTKVATGSQLVTKAGQTMDEIVASVQRVTGIMAEISAASQEQTTGIEQVNQTIVQMDETTQQNASLVEEASAAARSMEQQAGQLAQAVAAFRLTAVSHPTSPALAAGHSFRAQSATAQPAAASTVAAPVTTAMASRSSTVPGMPAGEDWQTF